MVSIFALAVVDPSMEISDIGVDGEIADRRPNTLELGAIDLGIDVQIDRRFVDDRGDLIARVVVVEHVGVQGQRAAQQGILGADFVGVDEFRIVGQRIGAVVADAVDGAETGLARRVEPAALIAARIGGVDQSLVGEAQGRGPVEIGPTRDLPVSDPMRE